MFTNFDWKTDEESSWDEELAATQPAVAPRLVRPWRTTVVILLLAVVAALLVGRQVRQRVQAATTAVREEVVATHVLVQQIAAQDDAELLRTFLSGRSRRWVNAQEQLLAAERLFDRTSFGLRAQLSAETETAEVTLAPDLSSATLVFAQPYTVHAGSGMTETITLQQTAVYRRGSRRWLLSPPPREFWGDWHTQEGHFISIRYRQRDQEIVARLATDLEIKLKEWCRTVVELHCPPNLHLYLRLDSDPAALLVDDEAVLAGGLRLWLPAPTLVGMPVDEAGYQALQRGYAAHVVTAVTAHLLEYECCQKAWLFRALSDKQLGALGLRPWPLTPTDYDQILLSGLYYQNLQDLWQAPATANTDWRVAYSFVDFLVEGLAPQTSVLEIQRRLVRSASYEHWLVQFLPTAFRPVRETSGVHEYFDLFRKEWVRFLGQRTTAARQSSPPIPLPDQDIRFVCGGDDFGHYRYELGAGAWTPVATPKKPPGAPVGDGFVVEERAFIPAGERLRLTFHGDNGEGRLVFESVIDQELTPHLYFAGADPTGRYWLLGTADRGQGTLFMLLDSHHCNGEQCDLQPIFNRPLWSPDGRYTIVRDDSHQSGRRVTYEQHFMPLYLGDARGQSLISLGHGFFQRWLDAETFLYLRQQETGPEIVAARVVENGNQVIEEVWLEAPAMATAVSAASQVTFFPLRVMISPGDRQQFTVLASPTPDEAGPYYTFLVDRRPSRRTVTLLLQSNWIHDTSFSPDGRFLTTMSPEEVDHVDVRVTRFFDLETGNVTTTTPNDYYVSWSAGGQWVIQVYDDFLLLMAPAHDYQRFIPHEWDTCFAATWMEE